jgi:hypothetical protein
MARRDRVADEAYNIEDDEYDGGEERLRRSRPASV